MNFSELVRQTRTIQQFDPGVKIPQSTIELALEASLLAPNHRLTFPWLWIWAGSSARHKIAQEAISLQEMKNGSMDDTQKKKIMNGHLNASDLLILVQKKNEDTFTSKEDYATLSCSVQLLALSLREQGFGYKWGTGAVTRQPETYEILGLSTDLHQIEGFIWIGKEAKELPVAKRPPLSDVLKKIN